MSISVADKGLGIAAEDRKHIFEPFYRGREAVSRQIQGSGLGLNLVARIAEAHGGRVEVTSEPGKGSRSSRWSSRPRRRSRRRGLWPGAEKARRDVIASEVDHEPRRSTKDSSRGDRPTGFTGSISRSQISRSYRQITTSPDPPDSVYPSMPSARLLLVEDEPGLQLTLSDRLVGRGLRGGDRRRRRHGDPSRQAASRST